MYDIIIIGAGPAGLTAGIYSSRARLKTLLIDKGGYGGQLAKTWSIENFPGHKQSSGFDLSTTMFEQAKEFGCEIEYTSVTSIENEKIKKVHCEGGKTFESKALIVASGTKTRLLNVPGEKEFTGKGVSYCGTCDGAFFKDKHVVTIGGGDTAVDEANFLTRFAKKVTMIHRDKELTAEQILIDRVKNNDKIDFIWNTEVKEIKGDKNVNSVTLFNKKENKESSFKCDGVFVFIGSVPSTDFAKNVLHLNKWGYIKTDETMKAEEGIFACGDCRENTFKQVVVACGEGAIAAHYAENFIR